MDAANYQRKLLELEDSQKQAPCSLPSCSLPCCAPQREYHIPLPHDDDVSRATGKRSPSTTSFRSEYTASPVPSTGSHTIHTGPESQNQVLCSMPCCFPQREYQVPFPDVNNVPHLSRASSPSATSSRSDDIASPVPSTGSSGIHSDTESPDLKQTNGKERNEITRDKYVCSDCGKSFKRSSSLSNHRLIHKNVKAYICDKCGGRFLRKSDLGKHQAVHTGIKMYCCDFCGRRFSQSSNMLTHRRRHLGVRPHECNDCGKTFYRKVDVRRHCKVHSKVESSV